MLSDFNRAPFNRDLSIDIFMGATFHGAATLTAAPTAEITAAATLHGAATFDAAYLRELFGRAVLHAAGTIEAQVGRELYGLEARFHGSATLNAEAGRYKVEFIEFTGSFAPGDVIVIDSAKFEMRKNGVLVPFGGDFFDINPGRNDIVYTDSATGRSVQVRFTWRDRYL